MITSVYPGVGQTSYTVNETDSVVFECTATGIPAPDLMFNFGDIATRVDIMDSSTPVEVARSQDGETVFQVTRTAVINSTVDSDSGLYMCTASNDVGNDLETVADSFELIVQGIVRIYTPVAILFVYQVLLQIFSAPVCVRACVCCMGYLVYVLFV